MSRYDYSEALDLGYSGPSPMQERRYENALRRHTDCRDPDHPGCDGCCEGEKEIDTWQKVSREEFAEYVDRVACQSMQIGTGTTHYDSNGYPIARKAEWGDCYIARCERSEQL